MALTANQVTLARIFLMPLPVALLIYGNTTHWWIAFSLFVLLGATDFIDGYMARIEGPTRFGSLIDPVADKIFVAAIFMGFSSLGIYPSFIVGAILTREFLLTALRSSVAFRKETMKTSVLGKLKTVFQMGGAGTIFLTLVLPPFIMGVTCGILSLPFFIVALIYFFKGKKQPHWGWPVFLALAFASFCGFFIKKDLSLWLQMTIIISFTWISAIGYLIDTYKIFKRTGLREGDVVRLMWSITHGLLVAPLVYYYPSLIFPILISISLEFSLGGIDNMRVFEKNTFDYLPFFISNIYGVIFVLSIKILPYYNFYINHFYLSVFLVVSSLLTTSIFFIKNIDLFKKVF